MGRRSWFSLCLLVSTACAAGETLGAQEQALEAGDKLVIRQVYGGGGNNGAEYRHDFVELFNAGGRKVSLKDLSLQYAPANGNSEFGSNAGYLTELPDVTLAPGQSFLVQGAKGEGGSKDLPEPYLVDETPFALGAKSARMALVEGTAPLTCRTKICPVADAPCDPVPCNEDPRVIDLLAIGSGDAVSEGTATAQGSNTTAATRVLAGCQDTNDNAADFELIAPVPRTVNDPATPCVPVEPEEDAGSEADAGQDTQDDAGSVDGGHVLADAGEVTLDAGHEPAVDAGTTADAGASEQDASAPVLDAGTDVSADASVEPAPVDAGLGQGEDASAPQVDASAPTGDGDGDVGEPSEESPTEEPSEPTDTDSDPATASVEKSSDCSLGHGAPTAYALWLPGLAFALVRRRRSRA